MTLPVVSEEVLVTAGSASSSPLPSPSKPAPAGKIVQEIQSKENAINYGDPWRAIFIAAIEEIKDLRNIIKEYQRAMGFKDD